MTTTPPMTNHTITASDQAIGDTADEAITNLHQVITERWPGFTIDGDITVTFRQVLIIPGSADHFIAKADLLRRPNRPEPGDFDRGRRP